MKLVESATLDSTIAIFFYENALVFNVADSRNLAFPEPLVDQCIKSGMCTSTSSFIIQQWTSNMSLSAASCACAQAPRALHSAQAHYMARVQLHSRAILKHASCQPSPLVRPWQNRSGWRLGDCAPGKALPPQVRPGAPGGARSRVLI